MNICGMKKSFDLEDFPSRYPDKRLILHFGAVDQTCAVWCNKKFVCSHRGGYLPFSAELTPYLRQGVNTITVRVQDETDTSFQSRGKQTLRPGGMFYTPQSGIWQTVWMEWVPENYITELSITPLFDESSAIVEITMKEDSSCERKLKCTQMAEKCTPGKQRQAYFLFPSVIFVHGHRSHLSYTILQLQPEVTAYAVTSQCANFLPVRILREFPDSA